MTTSNSTSTTEMREMLQALEKLQAEAVSNKHHFLAYLLDMARIEAGLLLNQQRQETNS
ncbi:MAG: hypothetical protein HKN05_13325 [Rhizobiales bacterium]|nr:hypothetical protein [Silicimonas sp.]NNF79003.1 hypothetical protein [Hyphomicrobiales bacterium]